MSQRLRNEDKAEDEDKAEGEAGEGLRMRLGMRFRVLRWLVLI